MMTDKKTDDLESLTARRLELAKLLYECDEDIKKVTPVSTCSRCGLPLSDEPYVKGRSRHHKYQDMCYSCGGMRKSQEDTEEMKKILNKATIIGFDVDHPDGYSQIQGLLVKKNGKAYWVTKNVDSDGDGGFEVNEVSAYEKERLKLNKVLK